MYKLNICYVAYSLEQKSVHWMKPGLKFMFHCVDMFFIEGILDVSLFCIAP